MARPFQLLFFAVTFIASLTCAQDCVSGQFLTDDGKCGFCNPPCKTCEKNADNCISLLKYAKKKLPNEEELKCQSPCKTC